MALVHTDVVSICNLCTRARSSTPCLPVCFTLRSTVAHSAVIEVMRACGQGHVLYSWCNGMGVLAEDLVQQ